MNHTLQNTTSQTLLQLQTLLQQMSPERYRESLPVLSDSSVGKHVRHVLEFYQCLFNGLPGGLVDYDTRIRDLILETDISTAIVALEAVLKRIAQVAADQALRLQTTYGTHEAVVVPTTLYRELIYNLEHCIHHQALIRIGVQSLAQSHELPVTFGVAPSTVQHQQITCAP